MKNLLLIFCLLPVFLLAQEDNPPTLFEVVRFKVKQGQEKQFEAAVKAHNAKYHGEGMHRARLTFNVNGPYGGMYNWVMGPTNFTALDSRPAEGAHDEDWAKTVTPHVESAMPPTYWSSDASISNTVFNPDNDKALVWVYDLKTGQGARFAELMKKIKKVYEEKRPTESYSVVWNQFAHTKAGMDAAIIWSFDKWAWMDDQRRFSEDYEAVHGKGTWHNFLNEFQDVSKGRVDWLRTRVD